MKHSKVAICLSGELRTFNVALPLLLNDFFNSVQADVFCHTWNQTSEHKHTDLELSHLQELVHNSHHNQEHNHL